MTNWCAVCMHAERECLCPQSAELRCAPDAADRAALDALARANIITISEGDGRLTHRVEWDAACHDVASAELERRSLKRLALLSRAEIQALCDRDRRACPNPVHLAAALTKLGGR